MNKCLVIVLIFFLGCPFAFFLPPLVRGDVITTFKTLTTSNLNYEYLKSYGSSYGVVRNATSATVNTPYLFVGQYKLGGTYYVERSPLYFDTTVIPDGATLLNATLSLRVYSDNSATNFNVTIQNGQPTYPHYPLTASDFWNQHYNGNGGARNSSTITGAGYWNISLSTSGLSWINLNSQTKLMLLSSRDIDYKTPTGLEDICFYSIFNGESYAPKLYVAYEVEGYHYIVHGPYYETGAVANCIVNVTIQIENMDDESYILNGTDGSADTVDIQIAEQGIAFTWNISSSLYNKTRTYYLTTASFEEIWIYVPHPDVPCYLYTFTITDFVGVTNAYLETVRTVGGYNRIVERQKLDVINAVPFWMYWAYRYDLRLTCDQGTYTWGGFIASTEQSQSLIIMVGMFPITYPGMNVTVTATRMNGTWIQINYSDAQLRTSWVQVTIKHRYRYQWLTDYTTNNTGNSQQINWYSADTKTDYVAHVTAMRDTQTTWTFSCPAPSTKVNPWTSLEDLGGWPIPGRYVVGLFLVLCVFGVFSYVNTAAGCFLGVLMAAFMTWLGWLDLSWNLIALGFAIVIFVAIKEGKKREYEIEGL